MRKLLVAALGAVLFSSACTPAPAGGGGGSGDGGQGGGGTGRSWTVLVYMVADNNLEPYGLQDIAEMAAVGSTRDLKIVVQADRAVGYSADPLGSMPDWTTAKRILVERDAVTELADLGEPNMGQVETLVDFVAWGVDTYPADRYALVFWDHGGAWPGFGGDESTRDHDLLDLPELKAGVAQSLQAAGLQRFDLIGFDACLMATYEVAAALAPYGRYFLASEELEPGHGWDYRSLEVLRNDPTTTPAQLGTRLISDFAGQAQAQQTAANITLSLVDLGAFDALHDAVGRLAEGLTGTVQAQATTLGRQRNATLRFGEQADPSQSFHMVDLGDLVTQVAAADASKAGLRDEVLAALSQVVVEQTSGPVTARASGLSIYFPSNPAYYRAGYDGLEEPAAWRSFLKSYFQVAQGGGGGAPAFTNADHVAEAGVDAGTLTVRGTLAAGSASSIASATLRYGLYDQQGGYVYVTGDTPAGYDERFVTGQWDLSVLRIAQGNVAGFVYLSVAVEQGNYLSASLPFAYLRPGSQQPETVLLRYVFDPQGNVVQASYYLITEAGPGELTPEPGSTMYPLIFAASVNDPNDAGWGYGTDQPLDATRQFDITPQALGAGASIYVELNAANISGAGDYVYVVGTL